MLKEKPHALFLKVTKFLTLYLGCWLPPEKHKTLYNTYTVFIVFGQYSFVFLELIYIMQVLDDLEAASEASYLLFTQAALCFKVSVFLMKRKNLEELIKIMDTDIFAPLSRTHEKILVSQSRRVRRLVLMFLTTANTTCTLWAMIPLFDNAGTKTFPFKIWMPVSPEGPHWLYLSGYLYQVLVIYISAVLFFGVDSVTLCSIMYGCAQLECLRENLSLIKVIPKSKSNGVTIEESYKSNYKLFSRCIKQHQEVVSFVKKVEDAYHKNIFFQVGGSAFIICLTGLRISIVDPRSVQFMSMVSYMVTMLAQLYLYCWCGHELTATSHSIRDVLYECPWYSQDAKFNRALWIAFERMKKPIVFRAGRYIPLSRQTFVTILRSSYSYFAVLQQSRSK